MVLVCERLAQVGHKLEDPVTQQRNPVRISHLGKFFERPLPLGTLETPLQGNCYGKFQDGNYYSPEHALIWVGHNASNVTITPLMIEKFPSTQDQYLCACECNSLVDCCVVDAATWVAIFSRHYRLPRGRSPA